ERARSRKKTRRRLFEFIFVLQLLFELGKRLPEPGISGLSIECLPQLLASFEQQPQAAVDLSQQWQRIGRLRLENLPGFLTGPGGALAQGDELGPAAGDCARTVQRTDRPPVAEAGAERSGRQFHGRRFDVDPENSPTLIILDFGPVTSGAVDGLEMKGGLVLEDRHSAVGIESRDSFRANAYGCGTWSRAVVLRNRKQIEERRNRGKRTHGPRAEGESLRPERGSGERAQLVAEPAGKGQRQVRVRTNLHDRSRR